MINEQELAEAVERLREGERVLGVIDTHVFFEMASRGFANRVLILLSESNSSVQVIFEEEFNRIAADLLREAYRTKLEHEAGL